VFVPVSMQLIDPHLEGKKVFVPVSMQLI
jgi:hypothetical protein